MKTLRNLLLLTACMLIGVAIAFYFRPQPAEQRIALGEKIGGDFALTSSQGALELEDFRGKVVLFFIGYASCPDVCPTALAVASQGMNKLSAEDQQNVHGIFMSVDPERDTLEKLSKYAGFFHPNFHGGTSDRANIDKIVKQYGAFYRKVELKDSALGYAIDHSSRIYLIDQNGQIAKILPHAMSPDQIVTEIEQLL